MWHVWGKVEANTVLWWGNLREQDHLGDPGVGGRIILKWTFRRWNLVVMNRIELAHGRDWCRAITIALMNLRIS
jgi:hypothetical protein